MDLSRQSSSWGTWSRAIHANGNYHKTWVWPLSSAEVHSQGKEQWKNQTRIKALETFSIRFFIGIRKLQFHVAGIQILARCSLFCAAMLFSSSQTASLLSLKKTGITHLFEFKNRTSTAQQDKDSYFEPLNVRLRKGIFEPLEFFFRYQIPCMNFF